MPSREFTEMSKTYVLDTNVLLYYPKAFYLFEEHDVVIPLAVIEEIDNQKRRQDEIGKNVRIVSQELDALRADDDFGDGCDTVCLARCEFVIRGGPYRYVDVEVLVPHTP